MSENHQYSISGWCGEDYSPMDSQPSWNIDMPYTCTSSSSNSNTYHQEPQYQQYGQPPNQEAFFMSTPSAVPPDSWTSDSNSSFPAQQNSVSSSQESSLATTLREAICLSTWSPIEPYSGIDPTMVYSLSEVDYRQQNSHELTTHKSNLCADEFRKTDEQGYVNPLETHASETENQCYVLPPPESTLANQDLSKSQTVTTPVSSSRDDLMKSSLKVTKKTKSKQRIKRSDATDKKTKKRGGRNQRNSAETIIKKLESKNKFKILRRFYLEKPWSESQDKCIQYLLRISSPTMDREMSILRNKTESDKTRIYKRYPGRYKLIKTYLNSKIKKWVSNSMSAATNNTLSTTTPKNDGKIDDTYPAPVAVVKPDPALMKMSLRKIVFYIMDKVPQIDTSWWHFIGAKLGHSCKTIQSYKRSFSNGKAKYTFNSKKMSQDELRFAKDVIIRFRKEKVYQNPLSREYVDDPAYDFGDLQVNLSEEEQRNVLILLLYKASPFGAFWDTKIAMYIDIKKATVSSFRRKALENKINYSKYVANATKKEDEISTHMSNIIKSWRDIDGNPYVPINKNNMSDLRTAMIDHLKENANASHKKMLEWSKTFEVPPVICYRVMDGLKRRA